MSEMICKNCQKPVKLMTPPAKEICSENCLLEWEQEHGPVPPPVRRHRGTTASPSPQRRTSRFEGPPHGG